MSLMSLEPVLMVRQKDSRPKPTSRFSSGSNTGSAKKKRKKTPNKTKPTMQRVMVLRAPEDSANLKTTWIWRSV